MKSLLLLLFVTLAPAPAPAQSLEGVWQGYDGEWLHVSQQLVALAGATPTDKFTWRPAPEVRSTSEVYMHIVLANFYLLRYTELPPRSEGRRGQNRHHQTGSGRLAQTLA